MEKEHYVLIVEDNPADAELLEIQVNKVELNISTKVIQSLNELGVELEDGGVSLVISDYRLENFTGKDVLEVVKDYSDQLPFVLVTGYLGEKKAIEIMAAGASDCIMKDELHRVGPVAEREILRYKDYKKQQELLKSAYSLAEIGHWELDVRTNDLFWSDEVKEIHEVEDGYIPTLEKAVEFYNEGFHRNRIRDIIERAKKESEKYEIDAKITTAKGNERWIRTTGRPKIINGECVHLYGSVQNITKQKQAELKLRDIFDYSTNLFYRHDINHQLTYVSPQSYHFLGCSPEEAMRSWKDFLTDHPENEKGAKLTEKAIRTGENQPSYKLQMKKRDGEIIWVRVNEAPVVENGKTVAMVGSLTDITELVESEQKQAILAKVAAETQNMVIITGANQKIEWVNAAFENITGYSSAEAIGKNPRFLQGPDTDPETKEYIKSEILNRNSFNTEILNYTKSGKPYWNQLSISPIKNEHGDVIKFFSIQEDVTERKNFLKRLKEKRERLEEAQRVGNIGDWHFDVNTGEIFWSDQMYRIYDRDPELGPPSYSELLEYYPEDAEYHDKVVQNAIKNNTSYSFDLMLKTKKGERKYIHAEGYPVHDDNENVKYVLGIVQDITERKEKELEITAKERQLRAVSDNVEALLFRYILKPDGTDQMIYISDSIERIYEVTAKEAQKTTDVIWRQVHNEDVEEVWNSVRKSAKTLTTWDCRFRIRTPSGILKWVHGIGNPTKLDDGSIQWDTVVTDVTKYQEQQKMNELLLQEVHHRVKNNLAIIVGLLQLQLDELSEKRKERLPLERAITRIYSIAEVHKLLYEETGHGTMDIEVQKYILKLIEQLQTTFSLDGVVRFHIEAEGIYMNPNELTPLGMLLGEFLTNSAKYAFDDITDGDVTVKISQSGSCFTVFYSDNGPGMDENTFEKAEKSGLKIIKVLLAQLEAQYQLLDEDGFAIEFKFEERNRGAQGNLNI